MNEPTAIPAAYDPIDTETPDDPEYVSYLEVFDADRRTAWNEFCASVAAGRVDDWTFAEWAADYDDEHEPMTWHEFDEASYWDRKLDEAGL